MTAPEGFVMPEGYNLQGDGIAQPYVSQVAGRPFRFYTQKEYNAKESNLAGEEVKRPVEYVAFKNDRFSEVAHRIDKHTFELHPEILADYQAWKKGVESGVTLVREWDAISYGDIGMLIAHGYESVEQIADSQDEALMILGTSWKDIKNRADQHVKAKKKKDNEELATSEFLELKQELKRTKEENAELRTFMEEVRESMKSDSKKKAAPKKKEKTLDELNEEEAKARGSKPSTKKRKAGAQD